MNLQLLGIISLDFSVILKNIPPESGRENRIHVDPDLEQDSQP